MSLLFVHVCTTIPAFLVCIDGTICVQDRCNCDKYIGIIDCSRIGLYVVPYQDLDIGNYSQFLLCNNHLKYFNVSLITSLLPTVAVIDLRNNNPLPCQQCQDLAKQRAPSHLHIIYHQIHTPNNKGILFTSADHEQPNKPKINQRFYKSTPNIIFL